MAIGLTDVKDAVVVVVGEGFASWFPAVGFLLRESVRPSIFLDPSPF